MITIYIYIYTARSSSSFLTGQKRYKGSRSTCRHTICLRGSPQLGSYYAVPLRFLSRETPVTTTVLTTTGSTGNKNKYRWEGSYWYLEG